MKKDITARKPHLVKHIAIASSDPAMLCCILYQAFTRGTKAIGAIVKATELVQSGVGAYMTMMMMMMQPPPGTQQPEQPPSTF